MLQKLGRYEIIEELGRGAMGVIYKARDPVIGRHVAIKTIRLGDFTDSGQVTELHSRLMREAQSAGVLSHPNIITIFDVGEEAGLAYFAMELVEGVTLEHWIESNQRLDEATIVHIARQTADALGFAHQRGIVHRDIKPANIMLTQDGRVKVADFGIAKVGSTKMTQTGMLLGSPSYMAPEHFLGRALDGRSDIFALGIVLYELITGQPPFEAENLGTLSYKIVHEDIVPPIRLKPNINPKLNELVVKALARDPNERFQTAEELCAALDALKITRPGSKTEKIDPLLVRTQAVAPPEKKRGRAGLWIAFFLLVVAAAGAGAALLYPEEFLQTLHRAEEKLQPWIDRARQAASSGKQPEPPTPAPETKPDQPPLAGEPVPAGTQQAKPSEELPPAPSTAVPVEEPAPSASSLKEPAPSSAANPAPAAPTAEPGTLQVISNPSGAEIVFDEKESTSWTTPYTFRGITKGRHTLEIRKSGYVTERRIVVLLGSDSQRVNVVLTMAAGILKVSTVPAGASIYVDGELKREVTPASLKIPAGARRILLRKEGYRDAEQVIEIEDNSITTLNQPLVPAP
ncbi:MAG: protein kinase [Acidobacteria bacterium]|nr:protein kinase [Acidobacteriota bacterium]MCI0721867.1 protein kinase [Acidobacteriota bacterium]